MGPGASSTHGRSPWALGLGWLVDALLPPRCLTCEAAVVEQGTQCAACFAGLAFIAAPICDCCGIPLEASSDTVCGRCASAPPAFVAARAALLYGAGARALIMPLKYGGRVELARPLARHMARAGRVLLAHADLLVPVPPHRWRLLARRYDQAALLAGQVARLTGKAWAPGALRRVRPTRTLGPLGAAARAAAVAGAFAVPKPGRVAGKHVLLVDDVVTSGATASACARALLEAGAASVAVLAAARVADPRGVEGEEGQGA